MNLSNYINDKTISVVLGGGAGTRLYPLTKHRSKPAVPIAAKYRLIDIPISNCLNAGLSRIFVLTQFNSASLNRHVTRTFNFDIFSPGFVEILAAEQTTDSYEWFKGTADAVRQSIKNFGHQNFEHVLILSGDQLYHMDFNRVIMEHEENGADLTIATIPVTAERATGFGIMKVKSSGEIGSFVEKPAIEDVPNWQSEVRQEYIDKGKNYLASMGIYVFKKKVLYDLLNKHQEAIDFGKQIIPRAMTEGKKVFAHLYDGYWEDIGDIKSFFEANIALSQPLPEFSLYSSQHEIYTRPRMLPPAKIFGTTINRSIIAEGSIIHAAKIENSLIGIRSRIGKATYIKHSYVIGNDYFQTYDEIKNLPSDEIIGIGRNCYIENVIVDKHAIIGDNVSIIGGDELEDMETKNYVVRKGIIVINKHAIIPNGSQIGLPPKSGE